MFYEPGKTEHGLQHDPFKACVVPRPIGWISTLSPTGIPNLAPYSQFNNLTFDPPYVMFAANQNESCLPKDSVRNAEATGVFCWNLATYDLRDAVKLTSEPIPASADEFEHAGLEKQNSTLPKLEITLPDQSKKRVPMVKRSPVRFECEYYTTLKLPGNPPFGTVDVVIGRVIGIHIDEGALTDGKIDVKKTLPIARLGYFDYAVVRDTFEMRPDDPIMRVGLEGNTKGHREMQVRQLENGEDKEEEVESKE